MSRPDQASRGSLSHPPEIRRTPDATGQQVPYSVRGKCWLRASIERLLLVTIYCTRCGRANDENAAYCAFCGASMRRPVGRADNGATQPIPMAPEPSRPRGGFLVLLIVGAGLLLVFGAGAFAATAVGLLPNPLTPAPLPTARPPETPIQALPTQAPSMTPLPSPTTAASPTLSPTGTPRPTPTVPPTPTRIPLTPTAEPSPTIAPIAEALRLVADQGYVVTDPNTYDPRLSLRVLLGRQRDSSTDHRAFFFLGDRYLGTDTLQPSAAPLALVSQDGTTIVLRYLLFRPTDPDCCPSGGSTTVRFYWGGERLVPLDPIPSDDRRAALSRR